MSVGASSGRVLRLPYPSHHAPVHGFCWSSENLLKCAQLDASHETPFSSNDPDDLRRLRQGPRPRRPRALCELSDQKVIVDAPDERRRRKWETGKHLGKSVEGARQKSNGKWSDSRTFPGREFDDLDEYRAAKKQRKERRAAYSDQLNAWRPH